MNDLLKTSLWKQFGAAIETLDAAIDACPDHLWDAVIWADEEDPRYGQFWFLAFHTVKWLNLYLDATPSDDYVVPPPFLHGRLPDQPYAKADVRAFLQVSREKCKATIEALTDESAYRECVYEWMQPTFIELLMYSMRHTQEHAGQLNYFLGEHGIGGLDWISYVGQYAD